MNAREQTLDLLLQVEDGAFATPLLEALRGDSRDVNFVRTILLGVLRWRLRLDYVIEKLAGRGISKIDRIPRELLRMGIYQLMFMEVPAYAAVSETVSLASRRAARAKGFVNAVLRRATQANLHEILPPGGGENLSRLSVELAHPEWLVERWMANFGIARTKDILASDQSLSHPDLFVNERRLSMDAAEQLLIAKKIPFERSTIVPNVFRLDESTASVREEIAAGLLYPMDEASVLVATLVDVQRSPILDLAAAPGGKSLVMNVRGGRVTSSDISLQRLKRLRGLHLSFLGGRANLVVSDGRTAPFRRGAFKTILLDAPCSATGTIRKSPEIKWRLTQEAIESFANLQYELLASALELEPEVCIYSTCSLEPEENDAVIERVLAESSTYAVGDVMPIAPEGARPWIRSGVLRITPDSGTDGFTAFMLVRTW